MSDQEVLLRKGKLLEDFVAAKTKLRMLQDDARREAKVLEGIVEFLKTGGDRGQISLGVPPETYLSEKVTKLIGNLRESIQEKNELKQRLLDIGVTVGD
jgi:hypothetical protein